MNKIPPDVAWADQFACALSRLDMPETATVNLLVELGKTLYETQSHLSPRAAADLERREWPPLDCFPNRGRST